MYNGKEKGSREKKQQEDFGNKDKEEEMVKKCFFQVAVGDLLMSYEIKLMVK